jgi:tRNA1Val (adenine37-N6)-methyltransferase
MTSRIDIFKFKQFSIAQNQNVHRVGTDGVLLGACANTVNTLTILDIGTGTGLIALMLAQRCTAKIIGIESDPEAYSIAEENFASSPWENRCQAIHSSVQEFHSDSLFDLIVCNPPFFENSLKPPMANRQQQRHTDTLTQAQLIENALRLLSSFGRLAVILPVVEGTRFVEQAQSYSLYLKRSCAVFSRAEKPQERWLLEFERQPNKKIEVKLLHIMNDSGQWTEEYKTLTKNFYLNF